VQLLVLVIALLFSSHLHAGILTFENLPDANFFSDAGVNIGTLYAGVTFGPGVTGLSVTRFGGYNEAAFPPHSGDVVVWSPFDFDTTIAFDTSQALVGVWYTSLELLTLTAYGAGNAVVGSATGKPNSDGFSGASSFLSVTAPGITSVVLSGSPGFFVFDDVTSHEAVAEPTTVTLTGIGVALMLAHRRTAARRRRR